MSWLLEYADLISAGCGLGAAVALGWPAFKVVRSKRYWEGHRRLSQKGGLSARTTGEMEKLGSRIDALQLGGAREAQICNLIGAGLLALSFIFLFLASIERRIERAGGGSDTTAMVRSAMPSRHG